MKCIDPNYTPRLMTEADLGLVGRPTVTRSPHVSWEVESVLVTRGDDHSYDIIATLSSPDVELRIHLTRWGFSGGPEGFEWMGKVEIVR